MKIRSFEFEVSPTYNPGGTCEATVHLEFVEPHNQSIIKNAYVMDSNIAFKPNDNESEPKATGTFQIKKVIFNGIATIVFWEDGTKTVIKRQLGDEFDPEKAIALCIAKKALGNKSNFNNVINKALFNDFINKALKEARRDSDV